MQYSLDRNWPELVTMLDFYFHLWPHTRIPVVNWQQHLEGVLRFLENLQLRFSCWDLAEASWRHKKGDLWGQMKRAGLIVKIDCKRQFTSELMKLWLPIREIVPDEIAVREETEHSKILRPGLRPRPQSSTLKIDPSSTEYLGCLMHWPTLPKLSS